ncbi:MFS transporter, partial [Erysipelatoclostridium ramosum]|nr:MFS transporter [Thomasclavelia ramosa]
GIQATARNVGQAIGVAVLGMVMIFTINANLGSSMEKDTLLCASLVQQEEAKNVSFMSDEAFIASLSDLTMKPQEQQELVHLNAQV